MWYLVALFTLIAMPARADISHKLQSSIQLQVDAAATNVTRIGSSLSISGVGVNTTDGTTAGTISTGTISSGVYSPGTISASQATSGETFSYSSAFTQGDAVPTAAVTVGDAANFSNITSTSAGTAGSLAGTISTSGAITVTAGGAGTVATGQYVSDITAK